MQEPTYEAGGWRAHTCLVCTAHKLRRRRPLQVIAALAAIPQPRMELQPARSAGKRWLRALQSPELRVSRGAGVSVATTSTRLRTCGRCLSGRAGTHRFEHDRYQLRACSPVQTCASKAERVYRVGSRRGARGGALASSPEDQRRTGPSAMVELLLSEAAWRDTPSATQNHAHLGEIWLRWRRSRTSRAAPHTNRSSSYRAKRGFSKILPSRSEATSIPAWVLQLRLHAQRLPRLTRPRRIECAWRARPSPTAYL
jgi:hypothetical protein